MKIIGKVLVIPGIAAIRTAGILIELFGKISSLLAGPFLVFVIGCAIYSTCTSHWRDLAILAAVAGACTLFYLLLGLILGLIDIASDRMKQFLHS